MNDYSDRLLQLDSLRNRLEALASPYLVSAISAGDTAKTANMVQVSSDAIVGFFPLDSMGFSRILKINFCTFLF